jgi:hypothetical protein
MTRSKTEIDASGEKTKKPATRKTKAARMAPASNGEILVKGVVMGIVISGITHTSKTITRTLVKHPLALLTTGLIAGYLTHKYHKDIIVLGSRTATESKNFVLRQKENLGDLVAEIREDARKPGQ